MDHLLKVNFKNKQMEKEIKSMALVCLIIINLKWNKFGNLMHMNYTQQMDKFIYWKKNNFSKLIFKIITNGECNLYQMATI
jgi:hypothetical protein